MSTPAPDVWRKSRLRPLLQILRNPLACAALIYLVLLIAATIFAPLVAPYKPEFEDLANVLKGPSGHHLLGTDELGRDVLSRLLYGGRVTLLDAAEAVVTFSVIGIPVGLVAGYVGRTTDRVIMTITDIVLSVPVIIVLLVVAAVFRGDFPLMLTLGIVASPSLIRVVRASTAAVKAELYVRAAEVTGLTRPQVLRRHVFPQVVAPILVQVTVFAAAAIAIEAALGFLGLDVNPPTPSWGSMVADASTEISQQPWLIVPSGLIIALTVTALGLVGDGIREVHANRRNPSSKNLRSVKAQRPARDAHPEPLEAEDATLPVDKPLLGVRGLSVVAETSGDDVRLVDNVSFDLRAGESLGIVGESGSGKTMTALALLGLLPKGVHRASGSVTFDGQELMHDQRPSVLARMRGREIALISQEPMVALDPAFTVGSLLRQALRTQRQMGRREGSREAIDLLDRVRLPDPRGVAERYPHELSGGMAQRVCIALALAGQPRVLVADEPTTALDVTVQAEILDLLSTLRAEMRMAILLVTHDWGVVADFCDRTAVMYAGQIDEIATVDAMFATPCHPYTEALHAANPHLAGVGPLPSIPGAVPRPSEWPIGCRFADRCSYVSDDCRRGPVPLVLSQKDHLSRCLHPERIKGRAELAS